MSPQNLLSQNVVFDVPLTITLERLEEKLAIDGTLSFVKSATTDKSLRRHESRENLIVAGTQVQDLLPQEVKSEHVKLVELLLSDSVVVPTMSK